MPKNKLPDRWLGMPLTSELLVNKFLIFKTPLGSNYDAKVRDEIFHVESVFQLMESKGVKLGLWIDLTNTTRYYDKTEVEEHNCHYVKLQCRKSVHTILEKEVKIFIDICDSFIEDHPEEIIGVHCTHGLNRSGFLVVSYLVQRMNWEVGAAIAEFKRVRPPGIIREILINQLQKHAREISQEDEKNPLRKNTTVSRKEKK